MLLGKSLNRIAVKLEKKISQLSKEANNERNKL